MRFCVEMYPSLGTWILMMSLVHVLQSQDCQMVLQNDKRGKDGTLDFGFKLTDELCNQACLDEPTCVAAKKTGVCIYWTDLSDIEDDVGSTVYQKICESEETEAPPPSCSTVQSANTDASNNDIELPAVSLTSCENGCKAMADCEYFVFIESSDSCELYNASSLTTSSQSGHITGRRESCDNGNHCCFETTSDQTITDSPTLALTSTQESCEDLCLTITNCKAAVFTGTTCKLFMSTPVTTSSSGVNLFTKDCPEGASTGSFTYTDTCESCATTIAPLTFGLILVIGASQLS